MPSLHPQARNASTAAPQQASPFLASRLAAYGATGLSVGTLAWYTHVFGGGLPGLSSVSANMIDNGLHPPAYPWSHAGVFETFDHAR